MMPIVSGASAGTTADSWFDMFVAVPLSTPYHALGPTLIAFDMIWFVAVLDARMKS